MKRKCFSALVLMMLLVTSCSTVVVDSSPPRAKVLIDGEETGMLTPTGLRVRGLRSGHRSIELQKEGYASSYQTVSVRVSAGKILMSWFPPMLLKFGIGDCWKIAGPGRIRLILKPNAPPQNTAQSNRQESPVSSPKTPPAEKKYAQPDSLTSQTDVTLAKLKKLAELRDDNLLTEDEYTQKRQAIIDNL